jgi:WD40 repeat protein/serine/threonine protein kinase
MIQVVRQTSINGEPQDPSPALSNAPASPGTPVLRYLGDYELLGEVGRGGMGVVYKARQVSLNRIVALKVIAPEQLASPKSIERFRTEAEAAANLDHPHIVPIHETGERDGRHYFSMKLIEGESLAFRIAEFRLPAFNSKSGTGERPSSQSQIAKRQFRIAHLLAEVADAVHYAHQRGILHRDLKPGNILIDSQGQAHVTDFGLAKLVAGDSSLTMSGEVLGTPAYMAPEQAAGKASQITIAADIYSLGVILYELLTGRPPFARATPIDTLHAVLHEDLPSPRSLNRVVARDLETICLKSLERDPARRYPSAQEFAHELRRFARGEPIQARAATPAEKVWRWCRRKPALAATLLLLHLVIIAGLAGILWEWQRARQNALIAQRNLYAADMNLVQQAWERNDLLRVSELLHEAASYPNRRFEWGFWQRQTHLRAKTLLGGGIVECVAFSPDGQRLAIASSDSMVRVLDAGSGKELLVLKGHEGYARAVAFSRDGQKIVTGGADKTARVWSAASGRELATLKGHRGWLNSVAFSPNGQKIVTTSRDGTAKVWMATGAELLTFTGHSNDVYSAHFSPDGQQIISGSWDRSVRVWNSSNGRELLVLGGHTTGVYGANVSPDNSWIASGSLDGLVKVWAANGREVLSFKGHRGSGGVSSVEFSPDSRRIATGSEDGTAKVWEVPSGKEVMSLQGHSAAITSVAFSPDGSRLATGSEDHTTKIWHLTAEIGQLILTGHRADVRSVAFSPDGRRVVTGSWDGTAKIWDAASGRQLLNLAGEAGIGSVAFSPDGLRVATGNGDETATVWDANTGRRLLELRGHGAAVNSVAFSPDGRWIATGSGDETAKVFDTLNGKVELTLRGHLGAVMSVAFCKDGKCIVTASTDDTTRIWDPVSGNALGVLEAAGGGILCVAFSPDGRRIVTGSHDGTAGIWDVVTHKQLVPLRGHSAAVSSVAFSGDGQRVLTGSEDQTAKIWDAASGKELLTLKGHGAAIHCVTFSPDGQRVITGGADRRAIIWDAALPKLIAEWTRREQEIADCLVAIRQKESATEAGQEGTWAQPPGAINQWLVLGPIAFAGGSGALALDQEQIQQESKLRPRAGERVVVGGNGLVWRALRLANYRIDFNQLSGAQIEWSVAYAACYIHSKEEHENLVMKVSSDDQAKIYLNGQQIYRWGLGRGYPQDEDSIAGVKLKAGQNILVFKVVNEAGAWEGSIRLTDAAGHPVPGIRVTLTPP